MVGRAAKVPVHSKSASQTGADVAAQAAAAAAAVVAHVQGWLGQMSWSDWPKKALAPHTFCPQSRCRQSSCRGQGR